MQKEYCTQELKTVLKGRNKDLRDQVKGKKVSIVIDLDVLDKKLIILFPHRRRYVKELYYLKNYKILNIMKRLISLKKLQ